MLHDRFFVLQHTAVLRQFHNTFTTGMFVRVVLIGCVVYDLMTLRQLKVMPFLL